MKKTILLFTLISTTSASSAFAKTEGSYLGINLLKNSAQIKSKSDSSNDSGLSRYYNHKEHDSSYGVGIDYKYAFNFDNFFVAPGISYNIISNKTGAGYATSSTDIYSQNINLNNQISFQTNFGYDVSNQFAVYIPVGISSFGYEIKTMDTAAGKYVNSKKSGRETAAFYGIGLSYQLTKNWLTSVEYNRFQTFGLKSGIATLNGGKIKADANIDMVKLGIAYNF